MSKAIKVFVSVFTIVSVFEKVYGKINKQRIIFATPTFDWPDDWPTL